MASDDPMEYRRQLSENGKRLLRWSLDLDDPECELRFEESPNDTSSYELSAAPGPMATTKAYPKKSYDDELTPDQYESAKNKLDHAMDLITEKKANLRMDALELIISVLTLNVCSELLDTMRGSLIPEVINILKKKSSMEEGVLACRALGLICITLGADEDRLYGELKPVLMKLALTGAVDQVRVASLEALAVACFVCSTDERETWDLLDTCHRIFSSRVEEVSDDLCYMAIEMWALLITSITQDELVEMLVYEDEKVSGPLADMRQLLLHQNLDVRIACGETFALMAEYRHSSEHNWSIFDEPPSSIFAGVLDRVEELAQESSKKVSKKGKKNLKAACRVILKTLNDNVAPTIDIQMKKLNVLLHKWSEAKQYGALKGVLKTGIQEHFVHNQLIRDILVSEETVVDEDHFSTNKERKTHYAKNSAARKQRTLDMRTERIRRDYSREMYHG